MDVSLQPRNRYALKEWAGVCERLARGEQMLLLRKGGLRERRGGFQVEHPEFFLFPTRFHEKGAEPPARVEMGLYARAAEDVVVRDLERLRALEGQHAIPWEDVERRFRYGKEPGLHVLAVRAFRLARPAVVEDARAYDGCVSWVDLERELPVEAEGPVLPVAEFDRRLEALRAALHG
jgi:hypothetical protein